LSGYKDVEAWWSLLISPGIAFFLTAALGALAYWVSFSNRKSSDFMIATEGEMKKVSWSSRREVIGSTKVVIVITILLAALLFLVDLLFQHLFRAIGVLKVG
jgi:preprotein translocase subunit SecE